MQHTDRQEERRDFRLQLQLNTLSAVMAPVFILCLLPLLEATSENVTVESGENVTLPCQSEVFIGAAEWTRDDLEPWYVLLNVDGHLDPTYQHQSFKGRVQLANRELKPGDVSLTLKNVNINDSGTYECRVKAGAPRRQKRAIIETEPIKTFRLEVTGSKVNPENVDPEKGSFPHRHIGLAGVPVAVIVLVVLVVFVFVALTSKKASNKRSEPADAEAGGDQLT